MGDCLPVNLFRFSLVSGEPSSIETSCDSTFIPQRIVSLLAYNSSLNNWDKFKSWVPGGTENDDFPSSWILFLCVTYFVNSNKKWKCMARVEQPSNTLFCVKQLYSISQRNINRPIKIIIMSSWFTFNLRWNRLKIMLTRINWLSALLLCFPAALFENIFPARRISNRMPKWLMMMIIVGRKTQHTMTTMM